MRRNPEYISFTWECPECHETFNVSYFSLATSGNPICPDCDEECELIDNRDEDFEAELKKAYQNALLVQSACNLSGVVNAFSRSLSALQGSGFKTDAIRSHPISILFSDKISSLVGRSTPLMFTEAYRECEAQK